MMKRRRGRQYDTEEMSETVNEDGKRLEKQELLSVVGGADAVGADPKFPE